MCILRRVVIISGDRNAPVLSLPVSVESDKYVPVLV